MFFQAKVGYGDFNVITRTTWRLLCSSKWPPTDVPEELEKRRRFWELERLRDSVLDYHALTEMERKIHDAHKDAVRKGHFTYDDPAGGGVVETRYKHFLTGLCCGNGCRHCIFNFYNVPKYLKASKTFNSSFWVDVSERVLPYPMFDLKQFALRKLKNVLDDQNAVEPKNGTPSVTIDSISKI